MKIFYSLFFLISLLLISCNKTDNINNNTSNYSYKKTKVLLNIVSKAAYILEKDGIEALEKYDKSIKIDEIYLYVYRISDAMCFYHGEDTTKINKAITDQTDYLGKRIHYLIVKALEDNNNPDSWVHFNWSRPNNIFPIWKSSTHKKVKMSDGNEVYIGAGIYGYISEREFIRISVDNAVKLIEEKGEDALDILQEPKNEFTFFDSFIFIFDFDGNSIIDPTYKDGSRYNILEFQDASNQKPFSLIKNNLKKNKSSWGQIQYKDNNSMNLKKKIIYAKSSLLDGKKIIVGAMINAPTSIWFK